MRCTVQRMYPGKCYKNRNSKWHQRTIPKKEDMYDSEDVFTNFPLGFANIQVGDRDLQLPVLRRGFILKK